MSEAEIDYLLAEIERPDPGDDPTRTMMLVVLAREALCSFEDETFGGKLKRLFFFIDIQTGWEIAQISSDCADTIAEVFGEFGDDLIRMEPHERTAAVVKKTLDVLASAIRGKETP